MSKQNTGWRDISTAPKDGTPILITASGVNPVVAFQSDVMPKWWLNPTGIEVDWFSPTSWQPLPPPPGEEASRKDWRKLACDAADLVEHLQEERDTLQARCDELEAAAIDAITIREFGDDTVRIRETIRRALRSLVDGGEDE